ncbi:MAG: GNAT family N-acetyltransferase [Planctomycetota bacterium]|jgi:ribosomal protein S18 acetylase RimI-like enzyme
MDNIRIKIAESSQQKRQLDELLWEVLWKPLDLPQNVRVEFKLPGEEIELIAIENQKVIGALVANRTAKDQYEIRHLAVDEKYQRKDVGTNLLTRFFELSDMNMPVRIQVHARNTSLGFFTKHGFTSTDQEWLDHPDFTKHGIRFKLLEKYQQTKN